MRVLVDLNLAPEWAGFSRESGIEARHWSEVGDLRAPDTVIMEWARREGAIVFTHDLDFSALLALTRARGPSVLQIRSQEVWPAKTGGRILHVLELYRSALEQGAIVTIDDAQSRVRVLPIVHGG